jgi:hypothetical protein
MDVEGNGTGNQERGVWEMGFMRTDNRGLQPDEQRLAEARQKQLEYALAGEHEESARYARIAWSLRYPDAGDHQLSA